ncbi:hypothetical protein BC833DRAFT_585421 [Globomyces pollinis-pini]|nr:hypothetical protein BC833DRAFT_585421 [Globomyces pollinis-pini]KAJ3000070.1 hypothetical protein HDV02_000718 [Globomyces sp. JEL0801]
MLQYLAILACRATMKEGRLSPTALFGFFFPFIITHIVAYFADESLTNYYNVLICYSALWFFVGVIFGTLSFGYSYLVGNYVPDVNVKSSAWPGGPYLHPVFRAIREIIVSFVSAVAYMDEKTTEIVQQVGYNHFALSIGVAFLYLVYQEYEEDSRFAKLGITVKPKQE